MVPAITIETVPEDSYLSIVPVLPVGGEAQEKVVQSRL